MKLNVAAGLIMLVILLTSTCADVSAQPGKKKGHYKGKSQHKSARYDKHPNHKRGHDKHYRAPAPQPGRTTVIYAPAPAPAPRPGAVVVPVPVSVPPHPSNLPVPPLPPHPGLPRR